jgi:hypothetical protein
VDQADLAGKCYIVGKGVARPEGFEPPTF